MAQSLQPASTARPGRAARPAGQVAARRCLSDLCFGKRRGPAKAIRVALEAAEIYRERLHDVDSAIEQYTRVLERSPGHPQATGRLGGTGLGSQGLDRRLALARKHGWLGQARLGRIRSDFGTRSRGHPRCWRHGASAGGLSPFVHGPAHLFANFGSPWSQLARIQGWWQDVCQTVPHLLSEAGDRLAVLNARSPVCSRQGSSCLRSAEAAAEALMKALALAPASRLPERPWPRPTPGSRVAVLRMRRRC